MRAVIAAILMSGCAGPKFVRGCKDLAIRCEAVVDVCRAEHERMTLIRKTCEADNTRLIRILAK